MLPGRLCENGLNGGATAEQRQWPAAVAAARGGGGDGLYHSAGIRLARQSAHDGTLLIAARSPALWLSSALATEMSSPGILSASQAAIVAQQVTCSVVIGPTECGASTHLNATAAQLAERAPRRRMAGTRQAQSGACSAFQVFP